MLQIWGFNWKLPTYQLIGIARVFSSFFETGKIKRNYPPFNRCSTIVALKTRTVAEKG